MNLEKIKQLLEENNQQHLLNFWEKLGENSRSKLLAQIMEIDFDSVKRMRELLSKAGGKIQHDDIEPAEVFELNDAKRSELKLIGEKAIKENTTAVLLVAGGQGSRLGFDGPKGMYPIGPVSGCSLFCIHARKILALERKYKAQIPFYVMTSQANNAVTEEFFEKNDYFGLNRERVKFFSQGMWPALFADGRIVMDAPDNIFRSPDGHGGVLSALQKTKMFSDMRDRGVRTIFYFQVDNPMVNVLDPAFVGIHIREKADISVKVCTKRNAQEGLGVVVRKNGRNAVVEYSELTTEQKEARRPDGRLKFLYGSVAIHIFSLSFMEREAEVALPLHLAHKKVPYCDSDGRTVIPDKPNAYKFEKFIFDVIPDASKAINIAFDREEEFAPLKNAAGDDSPATCKAALTAKYSRWLEYAGVLVPRDKDGYKYQVEIDPVFAVCKEDLKGKLSAGFKVSEDTFLS